MNLEEKIILAKELGITFIGQSGNLGFIGSENYNQLRIFNSWSDKEFELALDKVIKRVQENTFHKLLSKHDL